MKLVRFCVKDSDQARLGVWFGDRVVGASAAYREWARETTLDVAGCWLSGEDMVRGEPVPLEGAYCPISDWEPCSIEDVLRGGDVLKEHVRQASEWALQKNLKDMIFDPKDVRFLSPLEKPPKIVCIGMNYVDHCTELGQDLPKTPIVFGKFATALNGPDMAIVRPKITQQLDYEAELGVVIGKGGRHIAEEDALEHVAGYLNFNDVSARDLQFSDGQWVRAKTCDTFAPMGPALVTRDEIDDVQELEVVCRVNGKEMQRSNTRQMIFSVKYIVSFLSQFMTLEVGDVIATGTPPGVGFFRKPPVYLKPGDVVEVEIEGLGVLRNWVEEEVER